MRRRFGVLLALAVPLALVAVPGSTGPARIVPAQLAQARYVALGYDVGSRFVGEQQALQRPEDVFPEDRRALDAIRDSLEAWGRYVITIDPLDADLLIAVRAGRLVQVGGGVHIGTGGAPGRSAPGIATGPSFGTEVSSPSDMLTIYEAVGGRPGAALWQVRRNGGLSGSPPRLFEEFQADVERSAKPKP
jgi:hypothetical protein